MAVIDIHKSAGKAHWAHKDGKRLFLWEKRSPATARDTILFVHGQDKQFAVMPRIAHSSFLEKNYLIAYHILLAFFSQPEPNYTGE